jgi:exonuclease III
MLLLNNRRPYRPHQLKSTATVVVAFLLLIAGVESNPGPSLSTIAKGQPAVVSGSCAFNDSIILGCFNVRSVQSKSALIHDLIAENNIDILSLQETWLTSDTYPAIKCDIAPPGYTVEHVYRPSVAGRPSRGGGLAIVYRDHYKTHSIDLHVKPTSFEMQSLIISSTTPPILLLNIYQPRSPPSDVFFDELCTLISNAVVESSARLIICGDFNCPGQAGQISEKLDDVLVSHGLHQLVQQPTRGENLLDIIAVSDPAYVNHIRVVDSAAVSDHSIVVASLQSRRPQPSVIQFASRNLKRLNHVEFEARLRSSVLFTAPSSSADGFATQLQSVVTDCLNELVPLRTMRRRARKLSAKWLSAEAVTAKRRRRKLERHRNRSENDRLVYRTACRHANALINQSRKNYMRSELEACTDPRQRWMVAKKLLHSDNKPAKQSSVTDDAGLCEQFSSYFVSKIELLRHSISCKLSDIQLHLPDEPMHTGALLDIIQPVTANEVSKLISSTPSKSSNLDYLPTSLLKSFHLVFSELIAKLANLSFQEGCFPHSFKTALVSPLIKKPGLDPKTLSNYRPISNLNNVSKILEKLFLCRLQPHILASPNFNPYQSAYRRSHSTETALLSTLDHVYHSANLHKSTLLVSLDLSAAFDTIDHHILLKRLESTFGISGIALKWITSYLINRSQYVKVGDSSSNHRVSKSGVPQGSVLGPLLFTIYVSPIASLLSQQGVNQHQYADDTQLFISISKSSALADLHTLESSLAILSQWFSLNCLALNPDKSDAILLGTNQRNNTLSNLSHINVAGSTIPLSDSIKLLGVTLDKSLTFHKHVNQVSQSCYYHMKALRHIRHCLDDQTASLIAHSLISSRLDYANSVFYGAPNYVSNKLQRIQNSLARIVLQSDGRAHSEPLLQKLHWLPVHSRIHFKLATITYKALSTNSPQYLSSLLHYYQPVRSLRSSDQHYLLPTPSGTNFGSRSFRSSAPTIWNSIPLEIRSSQSIETFKRNLKTRLFTFPPV